MSARSPGARPIVAGLLLILGTCLHIAALILPFVEMQVLLSTEVYGLIPSTILLLNWGMYGLAALVIAFSIVFPFAKLSILWTAWNARTATPWLGACRIKNEDRYTARTYDFK
jgi:uncharacterized paraquat-inducible protein A